MNSPWLHQLRRIRPVASLQSNMQTDVTIVGGGIAGVSTAYSILKNTTLSVMLLEASKIGHGATGHNAGQVASYFERPFTEIVEEFGLTLAAQGQQSVESAWMILEEIIQEAQLQTPLWQTTGYAGLTSIESITQHLRDAALKTNADIIPEQIYVADHIAGSLPDEFSTLYTAVPQADILALLQTHNTRYIATLAHRKGCMNSALFCEELIGYLLQTYSQHFFLAEHTPVQQINLEEDIIVAHTDAYTVKSSKLVLCTNGFEHFTIHDSQGNQIDTKFHSSIHGTVGFMMGYLDPIDQPPTVISYIDDKIANTGDESEPDIYYYLTRRPFETENKVHHNLVCVGGPDSRLDDKMDYDPTAPYPSEIESQFKSFLHSTYTPSPAHVQPNFKWHGLMGYTPNSIRRIGPEPTYPNLLYNIGCNGVGILPSIYGSKRISDYIVGKQLEPSIFDIPE